MDKIAGLVIITLSTFLYSSLYPLVKKANQQLPPFTVMAISMFVLFLLSFFSSVLFENIFQIKTLTIKSNLPILIIIGIINFFAFWLIILSYKYFPVWQQTMFLLLTPVVAGVISYYLLGEKIGANLFIGLIIMGVGLFIAIR